MFDKIPKLEELKPLADAKGLSIEDYARLLIEYNTVTSHELAGNLGVAQSRVTALKKANKIIEIKKGLFLVKDAMEMRYNQLNSKTLKHAVDSKEYHLIPTRYFMDIETGKEVLFISKTRFSDCIVMVERDNQPTEYIEELNSLLQDIINTLKQENVVCVISEPEFRELKCQDKISIDSLWEYNSRNSVEFTGTMGLNHFQLFDWLARCKTFFNNLEIIENWEVLMSILRELILNDIMRILKQSYGFTEISLLKNTESNLEYKCLDNINKIHNLKIIKSTRRIAFFYNNEWEFDKRNIFPYHINI
jgi:hypothetical protein